MHIDFEARFARDFAFNGKAAGTYYLINSYDLGVLGGLVAGGSVDALGNTLISDIGRSRNIELWAQITQAVTGLTSVDFQLVTATTDWTAEAGTGATGVVVVQTTGAIAVAALVAGYQPRLSLPEGLTISASVRYLGLRVVTLGTGTGGLLSAGLVQMSQSNPTV